MKRKFLISLFTALLLLFILNLPTFASGDLYLNTLNFNATINEDGSMDVTENWDIEIEDTNTLYKTFNIDKKRYSQITNVSVKDVTRGANQNFTQSPTWKYHMGKGTYYGGLNEDGKFEIAWGVGLDSSSATKRYQISYRVVDCVKKCNDYAELYWQFVGEDFEVSCNRIYRNYQITWKGQKSR